MATLGAAVGNRGGQQYIVVNADARRNAGVRAGDLLTITLEPDAEKRGIEIPSELQKKLGTKLTQKLNSLSFTHKKEFSVWYSEAKKEDTRARRVEKMKQMLSAGRMLRTHDDIRAAVEGKATKYGALERPLVVAVNILDDFCEDIDIWNALFGEEQLVAIRQADGQWRDEWGPRVPNGAWRGRGGPRNTLVSAVVITHQLSPSNLRTHAVELIHNPWAAHPLPAESLQLPQRTVDVPSGQIHRQDGVSAAAILGIPEPWPVPDDE